LDDDARVRSAGYRFSRAERLATSWPRAGPQVQADRAARADYFFSAAAAAEACALVAAAFGPSSQL
jgi:hypothetical protein